MGLVVCCPGPPRARRIPTSCRPHSSRGHLSPLSSKGKDGRSRPSRCVAARSGGNLVTVDSHTGLWSPKQGASLSRRAHSRHDLGKWPARMSRTRSPVTPTRRRTYQGWTTSSGLGAVGAVRLALSTDLLTQCHSCISSSPSSLEPPELPVSMDHGHLPSASPQKSALHCTAITENQGGLQLSSYAGPWPPAKPTNLPNSHHLSLIQMCR
ncbi:hypothetical protein B0T18DRAFT_396560 [Schizothecium vesticola]|uniref:Uncharacterized protein n=1 Tax=Schizothecium vesticola TaxID=314040 RepID=A0AA40F8V7_9PEZI|nr:hypothetical protein B0T18DRAFT_396560 [Schizothecium vesticola]